MQAARCGLRRWKNCKCCMQMMSARLCSRRTNAGNINKNEARTAGAKVASFLFILSVFWFLNISMQLFGMQHYDKRVIIVVGSLNSYLHLRQMQHHQLIFAYPNSF